jgi:cellulose biosynthesis protein BcsQ
MNTGLIISIINHKGGIAKTTTTVNLGHALSRLGKKILIVDMDLQCNTTSTMFHDREIGKYSLIDILNPDNTEINVKECIHGTTYKQLYIIPNVRETAGIEQQLIKRYPEGLSILRDRMRSYVKANFDFVLIDNPPNLGTFVISSLIASDFVIVPNEAGSKYSLEGLKEAVNFIEDIRETYNPDLKFLRVLLTKLDKRMMAHNATVELIRNYFPEEKVFETTIPSNTDFQKSELKNETIFKFRSGAIGAVAYMKLAEEILTICGK